MAVKSTSTGAYPILPYTCRAKSVTAAGHAAHYARENRNEMITLHKFRAEQSNLVLKGRRESILTSWATLPCHVNVSDREENVTSDVSYKWQRKKPFG